MKKIIIIIPYFGKLPEIYVFWRQSALNNPSIDFLFVADSHIEQAENIKVLNITFEQLKKYMQKFFDFTITLPSPYKLCDFRPAYGDIFDDYIKEYDFWGILILFMVISDISLLMKFCLCMMSFLVGGI